MGGGGQTSKARRHNESAPPHHMLVSLLYCVFKHSLMAVLKALQLLLPISWRTKPDATGTRFFEGTVKHTRLAPVHHSFSYAVHYCVVDLEHHGAYASSLLAAGKRMTASEARKLTGCTGRVLALLLPESSGFEENPICVYYCYDDADVLRCCIAEVTNTPWGDRVAFPFAPAGDTTPKPLHVSPLQDMQGSWILRASDPLEASLNVYVAVKHPSYATFFFATLDADEVTEPVADPERWGFFMPQMVAIWIYWHAAVLLVRKGLEFFGHPKNAPELQPGEDYRDAPLAKAAAQGWKACPVLSAGNESRSRPYVFTDATEYPWT